MEQTVSSSDNVLNLYFGVAWFESWPEHYPD